MARKATTTEATTTTDTTTTTTEETTVTTTTETPADIAATLAEEIAETVTAAATPALPQAVADLVAAYGVTYGATLATDEDIADEATMVRARTESTAARSAWLAHVMIERSKALDPKGARLSQRDAAALTGASQPTISRVGTVAALLVALGDHASSWYATTLYTLASKTTAEDRAYYCADKGGEDLALSISTMAWERDAKVGRFAPAEATETPAETPAEGGAQRAAHGSHGLTEAPADGPADGPTETTGDAAPQGGGALEGGNVAPEASTETSVAALIVSLDGIARGILKRPASIMSDDERAEIAEIAAALAAHVAPEGDA